MTTAVVIRITAGTLGVFGAVTAGLVAVAALGAWLLPGGWKAHKEKEYRQQRVWDEILGVEAAPGVLARPSITQRLDEQDTQLRELHKYSHDFRHDAMTRFVALERHNQAIDARLEDVLGNGHQNGKGGDGAGS